MIDTTTVLTIVIHLLETALNIKIICKIILDKSVLQFVYCVDTNIILIVDIILYS